MRTFIQIFRQPIDKRAFEWYNRYIKTLVRGASVSDKFREVRQWDVGDDLGGQIRMIRSRRSPRTGNDPVNLTETEAGDSEIGSGSPRRYKNRPHLRRAHWHHYWVGEGRRKIVLKWINTMIVNAEDGETGVTVQNFWMIAFFLWMILLRRHDI